MGSSLTVANGWSADIEAEAFVYERELDSIEIEAMVKPKPLAMGGFKSATCAHSLGRIIVPPGGQMTFVKTVRRPCVSVRPVQGDNGYMCEKLILNKTTNVIVTASGHVVLSCKGKIWTDRNGRDHQPVVVTTKPIGKYRQLEDRLLKESVMEEKTLM